MKLDLMFGSSSDGLYVLPGIERFVHEHPKVEVQVHYASADNTPRYARKRAEEIWGFDDENVGLPPLPARVLISGAGMSNVLTGVVKQFARVQDLVIGVPIYDDATQGLSSFLATSERPPRNAVLTAPLNGTYAALNLALKFLSHTYDSAVILANRSLGLTSLEKQLLAIGIPYRVGSIAEIEPNDLVIHSFESYPVLRDVDRRLSGGKGTQIAFLQPDGGFLSANMYRPSFGLYVMEDVSSQLHSTGFVGVGQCVNAAIVAAQFLKHGKALKQIAEEKDKKRKKLEEHPGLLFQEGKRVR